MVLTSSSLICTKKIWDGRPGAELTHQESEHTNQPKRTTNGLLTKYIQNWLVVDLPL